MSLARPFISLQGPGKETAGREPPRSTGLPSPRAPRGRSRLLLTYHAEAEPPPPPSCPWVSRRGGREGGSGAGPVEDDAPPLLGRCCDSAPAPACAVAHIGWEARPHRPAAPPRPPPSQAPGTPGLRHRRAVSYGVQRAGSVAEGLRSPEPEASSTGRAGRRRAPRLRPGRLRLLTDNVPSHPTVLASAGLTQPNPSPSTELLLPEG